MANMKSAAPWLVLLGGGALIYWYMKRESELDAADPLRGAPLGAWSTVDPYAFAANSVSAPRWARRHIAWRRVGP